MPYPIVLQDRNIITLWRVVVKVVKFSAALFIGLFMMLAVTSQVATAQPSAAPASQGGTVPKPSSPLDLCVGRDE